MKNLLLTGLVALTSLTLVAQPAVEFSFSEIHIGRNVNLVYRQQFEKFAVYGGGGYFINQQDKVRGIFQKAGFARTTSQRFGARLGVEYDVFRNEFCKIGLFVENQTYCMSLAQKLNFNEPLDPADPNTDIARGLIYVGGYLFSENLFGASIQANLSESVYLTTRGALGIMYYSGNGVYTNMKSGFDYITANFSLGLGYMFKSKSRK